MLGFTLTLYANTTLQAKPKPKTNPHIPQDFILKCQQKSISHAYATFEAVIDKNGKPRCQGVDKTAKPHCPSGYVVKKRSCVQIGKQKLTRPNVLELIRN